ncbi:MAG: ABC transporter ATP-binding protein, partial [Eubacterium sp.]|nr:ABC transporter ATP-binding protein [Eubacterium sp.]
MSQNVVTIDNLVKRYGDQIAVDHFSLHVEDGEILGLLGPNGSGKTTTINCLLSLLKYDKGEITVFGKPMSPSAYDIKEKIGVVMQNVAVIETLNVLENVDFFCGLYIKDKDTRKKYVEEALEYTGLTEYKKYKPKKLSGGLLRRLN